MNAFERKISEQVALVTTLAIDINRLSTGFTVEVEFRGNVNALVIRFNQGGAYPKVLGKLRVYYILRLETHFEPEYQEYPFQDCCTIEQMVDVLQQTRQALKEGRTHDHADHATETDSTHSPASVDESFRVNGQLHPVRSEIRVGATGGTGGQSTGSIPKLL